MDQERDIEKLLRSAAKRRQQEAGPPIELHPADRRLLHQELARRFGQPKAARASGLWIGRAWPRLALSFGLILLFGIGAGYWLYTSNQFKSDRAKMTLASNESSARAKSDNASPNEVASVPASTLPIATDSGKLADNTPSEASKDKAYAADGARAQQSAPGTRMVPAPPTASTPALAAAPTPAPAGSLSATTLAGNSAGAPPAAAETLSARSAKQAVGNGAEAQTAMRSLKPAFENSSRADVSNPSPSFTFGYAAPATNLTSFLDAKSPALRQRFVQRTGLAEQDGRIAAPPTRPLLLTSFELSQSDGKVTIVDADGSIYTGYAQPADPGPPPPVPPVLAESDRSALKSAPAPSGAAAAPSQNRAFSVGAVTSGSVAVQGSSFFRVTGTNITLNQRLVFDGNLAVVPGAELAGDSAATASNTSVRLKAAAAMPRAAFTKYQISGKAQLGGSNTFEVQAISVPSSR